MKVLVTGGAGFIGLYIVEQLPDYFLFLYSSIKVM